MAIRVCEVAFRDSSGVRHSVQVEAETLYEAVVLGVTRLRKEVWVERVNSGTLLEVEVREPATKHAVTFRQVEQWLGSTSPSPAEKSKKAKLSLMLVQGT
jgi:hypothetical protein